ncbi:FHA domain-containing protein [Mycobacterium sp. AZCC_0083]|uniref:FHA domain-containing protein n=1 Tax=Mycobacterium sp. AZCC_0083 TaxID=2735882 RepID=UPI00161EB0E9|nr:FHA domain-containing protein [Mycobacterium sp. AZCC_0083]MBB5163629.1 hypothetical protein [Mycobacterium sp. AZCC_0083]
MAVGRGDGLVARTGDAVMYIADETAGAAPLLAALDATAGVESPGRALAKALATIALGPDSALIPPFGLVAPTADGLLLILRGPVTADVESDGQGRRLTGERALTWVDETLPPTIDKVTIGGPGGLAVGMGGHTVLRAGVVPAGGFAALKLDSSKPVAPQPHTPERRDPPPRQAPRARPPAQAPAAETANPRPVAGALTTGGDAVYPLDRPYVIGRNPLADPMVRDSAASPIVLADDPQISRVHAYVTVGAESVFVRDAGTPAGTYVAAPGASEWTRVGVQPVVLQPGWCLRIGSKMLTYQATGPAQ